MTYQGFPFLTSLTFSIILETPPWKIDHVLDIGNLDHEKFTWESADEDHVVIEVI